MNVYLLFKTIHLIAVISPGPDFALVIRQSIQYNRKTAIISSIGIASGILIHIWRRNWPQAILSCNRIGR